MTYAKKFLFPRIFVYLDCSYFQAFHYYIINECFDVSIYVEHSLYLDGEGRFSFIYCLDLYARHEPNTKIKINVVVFPGICIFQVSRRLMTNRVCRKRCQL